MGEFVRYSGIERHSPFFSGRKAPWLSVLGGASSRQVVCYRLDVGSALERELPVGVAGRPIPRVSKALPVFVWPERAMSRRSARGARMPDQRRCAPSARFRSRRVCRAGHDPAISDRHAFCHASAQKKSRTRQAPGPKGDTAEFRSSDVLQHNLRVHNIDPLLAVVHRDPRLYRSRLPMNGRAGLVE